MTITTTSAANVANNQYSGSNTGPGKARGRLVFALLTIVLLFGILLFPGHPESFTSGHFAKLPLEWPLIVLALLLATGLALTVLRYVLLFVLALLVMLRTADIGSYIAFDRRFSPMVEWHLLGDGWNLASQQVGLVEASLVIALVSALLIGLAVALFIGLGAVGRLQGPARQTIGGLAVAVLVVGVVGLWLQDRDASEPLVQAGLVPELIDRSNDMKRSIIDQQKFIIELEQDPLGENEAPQFAALEGLDVAFIFIESYGQSFLLDEDLGKKAEARLAAVESDITNAGLYVRSGWMTSPVRGGRSWLAHASFASGLAITNQARHDRLVASERVSLYSLFSQAGWHTAGLVPAIRESWPEGAWYGFDKIYDFPGMNYQGEPFGWVTMPDQYTLSTFEHTIRQPGDGSVMAEIALISSHAPWTPLPELLPWESIGDGSVFDGSHRFGEPMTWNDRARVREMFAKSLDYSLETVGEYLARYGKGGLFVVHGDHQPAAIIAGWGKTADVPIHIFSDDPELLERLPADVFTKGILPQKTSRSLPMWSMREMMATVFEDKAETESGPLLTE